jgi:small GTP-binding protein
LTNELFWCTVGPSNDLSGRVMTYLAVLLGDSQSGKSSIASRCIHNSFDARYQATIAPEYYTSVAQSSDEDLRLELLDTSGKEIFKNPLKSYYRRAEICVYCVDLTKPLLDTVAIKREIEDFKESAPRASVIIVGTKSDLSTAITANDLDVFAREQQYDSALVVSAKNNDNIFQLMDVMDQLAKNANKVRVVGAAITKMAAAISLINENAPLKDSLCTLDAAIAALEPSQREKIGMAAYVLITGLQARDDNGSNAIIAGIELFERDCKAILSEDALEPSSLREHVLKVVATVVMVVLVTAVALMVGFGIGFAAGLWTGPGAFISGVLVGAAAATAAVASSSVLGVGSGALTANSLFKAPLSAAKSKVLDAVDQVKESMPVLS